MIITELNQYQELAGRTSNKALTDMEHLENGLMGICGEAGECIDILKKTKFQGHPFDRLHMAKEISDVAWYLAEAATGLGFTLSEICQMNIDKLTARYPDGFDTERSQHRAEGDI